jgi:hypothetical protein
MVNVQHIRPLTLRSSLSRIPGIDGNVASAYELNMLSI